MDSSYNSPTTKPIFRITQVIWAILVIIEVLLAFRLVLKIMAANAEAGFTSFIYVVTWPFAQPFLTVFKTTRISGNIFEWTTLLAMLVYLLIAVGIIKLLSMSKTVSTPEAASKLDEKGE